MSFGTVISMAGLFIQEQIGWDQIGVLPPHPVLPLHQPVHQLAQQAQVQVRQPRLQQVRVQRQRFKERKYASTNTFY